MLWKMRSILKSLCAVSGLLLFAVMSLAQYTGVDLNAGGFASRSLHPNSGPFIAGSFGYVVVAVNSSDRDTKPASSFLDKPDWLNLEFGYGKIGTEFTPSDEVTQKFSPVYFVDHAWADERKTASFFFAVNLPSDLLDTSYCVRALIFPPPYGPLQRKAKLIECFRVVSPSSDADHDRVLASRTDILFRMGEYNELLGFADSLDQIARFVEDVMGTVIDAAKRLERYDRALYYLDRRHEIFGDKPLMRMNDIPPFVLFPIESQESADARYKRQRQDLLDKIGGKE